MTGLALKHRSFGICTLKVNKLSDAPALLVCHYPMLIFALPASDEAPTGTRPNSIGRGEHSYPAERGDFLQLRDEYSDNGLELAGEVADGFGTVKER